MLLVLTTLHASFVPQLKGIEHLTVLEILHFIMIMTHCFEIRHLVQDILGAEQASTFAGLVELQVLLDEGHAAQHRAVEPFQT